MHINKINFKKYVGQTVYNWNNINRRFGEDGSRYGDTFFGGAIKKYGWDNFYHICLADNLDNDELDYYEQMYIKIYNTYNGWVYNFTEGGQHLSNRDYAYMKIAESRRGENHPLYGKHLSEETKNKMSRVRKGRKHSSEWNLNISNANKGRDFSEEHKRKLSEAHKGKSSKGDRRREIVCFDTSNRLVGMNKDIDVLSKDLKLDVEDIREFLSVNNQKDNIKGYRFLYKNYYNMMVSEDMSFEEVKERYNSIVSTPIKGIKRSEETKKKMADAKIARAKYVVAVRLSDNKEIVFHSAREVERVLGINNGTIYQMLKGSKWNKQAKGYVFRYATEEEKLLYDKDYLSTLEKLPKGFSSQWSK